MSKLQPNFSWQKYEGKPEDQKQQFQYQLQTQHIQVANSVNATIDDESYFITERQTGFAWMDGRFIWKKTFTGTVAAPSDQAISLGIMGAIRTVILIEGTIQNAVPVSTFALSLPYVDPNTLANGVGVYVTPTQLHINTGNASWNNYIYNVTIYYTKV